MSRADQKSRSRLWAAVAGISDHDLYCAAQEIAGRIDRGEGDPAEWVSLVECLAKALPRISSRGDRLLLGNMVDGKAYPAASLTDAYRSEAGRRARSVDPVPPSEVVALIQDRRREGRTLQFIADELNAAKKQTPGGSRWSTVQVRRVEVLALILQMHKDGQTSGQIADYLKESHCKTSSGLEWTASRVGRALANEAKRRR